jgi:hypothetical protein
MRLGWKRVTAVIRAEAGSKLGQLLVNLESDAISAMNIFPVIRLQRTGSTWGCDFD